MNETITLDPSKNYLQPGAEPFFISSVDGKQVEILRPANHDPIKEAK